MTSTKQSVLEPKPFVLDGGKHSKLENGACFNELASVLAGEPFSDSPACVSPVIRRFGMALNDRLDDERRQLLRPYVLRSLGTAGDGRDEERQQMCREWLLHHALPDLLDKAGEDAAAQKLRDLPGDLAVEGVRRALAAARDTAWNARTRSVERLRELILAEMKKQGWKPVAAVATEAAEATEAAVATEAAEATEAAGAAGAASAAGAAEAAGAAGAAVAAEAAGATVAAEATGAAVAAVAFSYGSDGYWKVRDAVYAAVYPKMVEVIRPQFDELLTNGLDLLDRMLPKSPLQSPVVDLELAKVVCSAPEAIAA